MAARPQRVPTAAEEAILSQFEALASELPGDGAVRENRRKAIAAFERDGLPTRRIEAWHYTDLRTALREIPAASAPANANTLPALDGAAHVIGFASVVSGTPMEGVEIEAMRERFTAGTMFAASERAYDTIGQINGAFATDGAAIVIDAEAKLSCALELQSPTGSGQAHYRNAITVGAGADATLIERHVGVGDEPALGTTLTELTVADGANVLYVVVQGRGAAAHHLAQLNATLGKDARLTLFLLQAGSKVVRQEINVEVVGEGADFQLRGINLLGGESLTDTTMVVNHAVPNTTSEEVFRNVGTGRGRGVFQGQIKVAQPAQKTDAKMACNTLLLSDDAEFAAKPELEIFADDVACGHGATVDDLDATQLFYLMARGIPEPQARALLVKGFAEEMLEAIEDEALSEAIEAIVDEWLEANA